MNRHTEQLRGDVTNQHTRPESATARSLKRQHATPTENHLMGVEPAVAVRKFHVARGSSPRRAIPTFRTLALLLFASTLTAAPNVELVQPVASVSCYEFVECTLKVTQPDAANPFTDVAVQGEFGIPGQAPVMVDGFCDAMDGSVYRVRFMPSKPGDYALKITYKQADVARSFSGQFTAVNARKRGIIRVDPEFPSHFQFEGTRERFFWNGTTAYFLAGWDDESIRSIIDRLDHKKVTRVRAALNGRVKDGNAWFEDVYPTEKFSFLLNPWTAKNPTSVESPEFDVTRFNVAHWQKYERLLEHARTKDMAVSVIFYVDGGRPGVDPFGKEGMGGSDEQRYYRYAIARLAPFCNVMWDLANEYRLFRDDAWAEKMGAFVKQHDPYRHLTSTHGHGDFRFPKSEWADFAMYQSWDESGGWEFMFQNRLRQAATGRMIPQVNEEYGYEDHYPQGWGGNRKAPSRSALTRVRLAWEIALAGGYQTTGERATQGTDRGPDTGGGWINGRGDDQMTMLDLYGHMYDFFTSITWWQLMPHTNLVASVQPASKAGAAPASTCAPKAIAARNADGTLAVVYVRDGGTVSLIGELLRDQLKPLWFSPRDGGMRNARALRERVYRTPTPEDWVLLFRSPCNCSFRDFDNEFEK